MKKAKIVLSAIAVFAVIGGAFAFTATRNLHPFFKTGINGVCTVPTLTTLTTDLNLAVGPPITITSLNVLSRLSPCTTTIMYPAL